MEFYTTNYRKKANSAQKQEIKKQFDAFEANGDSVLNTTEFFNIFADTNLSETEQGYLVSGVDVNDDGFIDYSEFTQAFVEIDVNKDGALSGDEFDYTKKRIEELQKQMQINAQYAVISDVSSTEAQKTAAQNNITLFTAQKDIIITEENIKTQDISISVLDVKIQAIMDYLENNTVLEYEQAQKMSEIAALNQKKTKLNLEKDIYTKQLAIDNVELGIIVATQNNDTETKAVLEQQKISRENELKISETNVSIYTKQQTIATYEKVLNKLYVPELVKTVARKKMEALYDDIQMLNQQKELYSNTSTLSQTRAQMLTVGYEYEETNNPELAQQYEQLNQLQLTQQVIAQVSSLKVNLLDKQQELKNILAKKNQTPYTENIAKLRTEITSLQSQIAELE